MSGIEILKLKLCCRPITTELLFSLPVFYFMFGLACVCLQHEVWPMIEISDIIIQCQGNGVCILWPSLQWFYCVFTTSSALSSLSSLSSSGVILLLSITVHAKWFALPAMCLWPSFGIRYHNCFLLERILLHCGCCGSINILPSS